MKGETAGRRHRGVERRGAPCTCLYYSGAPPRTCLQELAWLRGTLASEVDTSCPQREVSVAASWSGSGLCQSWPADVLQHPVTFACICFNVLAGLQEPFFLKAAFAFTAKEKRKRGTKGNRSLLAPFSSSSDTVSLHGCDSQWKITASQGDNKT